MVIVNTETVIAWVQSYQYIITGNDRFSDENFYLFIEATFLVKNEIWLTFLQISNYSSIANKCG